MAQFDKEDFEKRLLALAKAERETDKLVAIAARAALRATPLLGAGRIGDETLRRIVAPSFRCMLSAASVACAPDAALRSAAFAAARSAADAAAASAARSAADAAADAARYAASARYYAGSAAAAAVEADYCAVAGEARRQGGVVVIFQRVDRVAKISAVELMARPLWSDGAPKDVLDAWARTKTRLLEIDPGWRVLIEWYEERADKGFFDGLRGYERQWALLSDEEWDQEPPALFKQLQEIKGGQTAARPLRAARAIFLGHGGAGKTSLIRGLQEQSPTQAHEVTPGAERTREQVTLPDGEAEYYLDDFGGQVMAHATHAFFLKKRCLYVIVIDGRNNGDAGPDAKFWLHYLDIYAEKQSPALIVGAKAETAPIDAHIVELQSIHPGICADFLKISCEEVFGEEKKAAPDPRWSRAFDDFKDAFLGRMRLLAESGPQLTPEAWDGLDALRAALKERKKMTLDEAAALLAGYGETVERARERLDLYEALGLFVRFDTPELRANREPIRNYIFDSEWIMTAVYKLPYDNNVQTKGGRLAIGDAMATLSGHGYSDEDAKKIIDALLAFKVAFKDGKSGELVLTALLDVSMPGHGFDRETALALRFQFDQFLPPQVLPALLADSRREHDDDYDRAVWRNGALLKSAGGRNAKALVEADPARSMLYLYADGGDAAGYLDDLSQRVEASLEALGPSALRAKEIRLGPDAAVERGQFVRPTGPVWVPYRTVKAAEDYLKINEDYREFPHDGHLFSVKEALKRAMKPLAERTGDVFISYAHQENDLRARLHGQLYYQDISIWWDQHLTAGDEWREQLQEKIDAAKAVVVIWTPYSVTRPVVLEEAERAAKQAKLISLVSNDLAMSAVPHGDLHALPYDLGADAAPDVAPLLKALSNKSVSMRAPQ